MKKLQNIHGREHGIDLKKVYGQHFLREQDVVDNMLDAVTLDENSSVFEIGCGDGFLTKSILEKSIARLWIFEIDKSWADYVLEKYKDSRMTMINSDILDIKFDIFNEYKPWILLANLPYQITFPLIYKLIEYNNILGNLLKEGVVMVQEEVAQKIVQEGGRGYGFNSLYLQHFFDWKLLDKIAPTAFYPPPRIYSRLLYFKPKKNIENIPDEKGFWIFIQRSFSQPRRNLKNNLKPFHYNLENVSEETLNLRGQQMNKEELVSLWNLIRI